MSFVQELIQKYLLFKNKNPIQAKNHALRRPKLYCFSVCFSLGKTESRDAVGEVISEQWIEQVDTETSKEEVKGRIETISL